MSLRTLILLTGACLASGCATHGVAASRATLPRGSGAALTAAELQDAPMGSSLFDVIRRTRPHFLRMRRSASGAPPTVVLDGAPVASLAVLRELRIEEVLLVRLLEAPEATMRYGTMYGRGVLEVTTHRGRPPS